MYYPNIVFDMGGVLLDYDEARLMSHYFGDFTEAERVAIHKELYESGLWRRMDRGDFDEFGMARAVCDLLPPHQHAAVTRMVTRYFEVMPPLPANELIPQLKARGQRVYLLTNAPLSFHREKFRLPYLDLFDGVFASCDVHMLKPDAEFYYAFLQKFSLCAKDCFFIDDLAQNIAGAAAVGIAGHCFADRDFTSLKETLGL